MNKECVFSILQNIRQLVAWPPDLYNVKSALPFTASKVSQTHETSILKGVAAYWPAWFLVLELVALVRAPQLERTGMWVLGLKEH